MRELVVLPLVPVMATLFTSFASSSSRLGQSFSAQRPGMAVPPRCSRRDTRRRALQRRMASMALRFMAVYSEKIGFNNIIA